MKKEELLSQRPRMLREHAGLILDMPVAEIPDGAFRAWLGRYRKANTPMTDKKQETGTVAQKEEGKMEIDDWRNFQPSKPVSTFTRYDPSSILRPIVGDPEE